MPNPYNDVELTEEDKGTLYNETESSSEVPKEESSSEANEPEGSEEEKEEYSFELDGKKYSSEDISNWKKDSDNKEEWQKSNTQKAQEIAKVGKLLDKYNKDDEFSQYIKDFFYDNPDELKSLGLEDLKSIQEELDQPEKESSNSVEERLDNLELDKRVAGLENQLDSIMAKNPEFFEDSKAEMKFLDFVEDNEMIDLDEAFLQWSYPQLRGQLDHYKKLGENKKRNQGKVVHNAEVGAKDVSTPQRPTDYKDINMNNPDVAKYFE